MEPAILDIARQAAAKVETAGVRLDELRDTIAFFFPNAQPDDPTEGAGDRRYTRRLIVSEVWRILTLNARSFEGATGSVTANARLVGAFSRAVSAIERLGYLARINTRPMPVRSCRRCSIYSGRARRRSS